MLPTGGLAPWFEAAALKARSLAVIKALEEGGRWVAWPRQCVLGSADCAEVGRCASPAFCNSCSAQLQRTGFWATLPAVPHSPLHTQFPPRVRPCRQYGMHRVGEPAFCGQLLEGALFEKRWQLVQELLDEHDTPAVTGMRRWAGRAAVWRSLLQQSGLSGPLTQGASQRPPPPPPPYPLCATFCSPPVCVALRREAPADLVRRLVELTDTLRSHVGGAAEAERGGLPPAALAAQAGQLEVLDQVS